MSGIDMSPKDIVAQVLSENERVDKLGRKQLNYLIDSATRLAGREVPDVAGLIREEFLRRRGR